MLLNNVRGTATRRSSLRTFRPLAAAGIAFAFIGVLGIAGCSRSTAPGGGQVHASSSGSAAAQQAGSSSSAAKPGKVTFTDDLGNEVTVDDPQRVVVGMGSLADIWRDAGGEAVGVSDDAFDNFGFDKTKVAGIGRHTSINLESIMALNPDFVILSGQSDDDASNNGPSQDQLKTSLENSGIPVAFFSVDSFDDYLKMLKTCTTITGRDDLYQKNGADVQKRVKAALKKYDVSKQAPSVLVLTASSRGAKAQAPDHMASLMVKQLGAKLVTEEHPSLLKDFSMEAVAEIDPDYIFVLPAATSDEKARQAYDSAIKGNPAWAGIGAVSRGDTAVLDIAHFFRKPNAEWDQAYETLGKALAASTAVKGA